MVSRTCVATSGGSLDSFKLLDRIDDITYNCIWAIRRDSSLNTTDRDNAFTAPLS